MSIGNALRRIRESKYMSQEEIANQLGVSKINVSHWEANRRDIPVKHLVRLPGILDAQLIINKDKAYFHNNGSITNYREKY